LLDFPLITDTAFYLAAVPAVLLLGISKSGFGTGIGALAVPIMALTVPVPQAAAILLPVLALVDVLGIKALAHERDKPLTRRLLGPGLAGVALGAATFGLLNSKWVAGLVGALTLLLLFIRLARPPRADAPPPSWAWGRVLAITSGFTSFVAHAGGPPISFYVIPMKLAPRMYAGTMAVYFTAINFAKWLPYGLLGLLDWRNLGTSLVLLPLAPVGVWLGLRLGRRIGPVTFYRLLNLGLLATGLKLLWDGVRAT
jgi:uncharacterized protein